jgi:hypothetical protein
LINCSHGILEIWSTGDLPQLLGDFSQKAVRAFQALALGHGFVPPRPSHTPPFETGYFTGVGIAVPEII